MREEMCFETKAARNVTQDVAARPESPIQTFFTGAIFYGRPFTAGCSASHRGLGPAQRTAGPVQRASRSPLHGGQRAARSPMHRGLGPAQRTEGYCFTLAQRAQACTEGLSHCFCDRGLIGRAHNASIAPTPRSPLANVTEDCFAPRAEGCPHPQRLP